MPSPQDRLEGCWHIQDCERCIRDSHGCGWCPFSSACIPASTLLDPLTKRNVCPLQDERFELRTAALGCGCSTTTLISIVVTIFATIAAVLILYCFGFAIGRLNRTFGSGTWQGFEMEIKGDGTRIEREWRRSSWIATLKSHLSGGKLNPNSSEQKQLTERSRLLG